MSNTLNKRIKSLEDDNFTGKAVVGIVVVKSGETLDQAIHRANLPPDQGFVVVPEKKPAPEREFYTTPRAV